MKKTKPIRAKKQPVTPEDLLQFELVSDPQTSPDGRHILFCKRRAGEKNQYVSQLWVVPSTGGAPQPFTKGERDAHGRWSPDGKHIAFIRSSQKGNPQIYLMSREGGEARALTQFPPGSIASFKWSPDGKWLAVAFREQLPEWTETAKKEREEKGWSTPPKIIETIWYRLDGDGYFLDRRYHLYLVDVETGKHRKIFDKDPTGMFSYDWSPDSTELALSANLDRDAYTKPWRQRLYRLALKTGKLTEIPNQPDGTKEGVLWSPDGRWIAFVGREGRDDVWSERNEHLFLCDPVRGKPINLTGHTDYCLAAATLSDTREASFGATVRWSPDSRRLFMSIGWHGEQHIASVSVEGGPVRFHTLGKFEYMLGTWDQAGKVLSFAKGSPTRLHEIGVARPNSKGWEEVMLTDFNGPFLNTRELSEPEEHWVTSEDGTKVHLWVLKPPGLKRGERVPAILEIHGGPHAQYGVPFFHEFQLLAGRGYAVFYSNPRGSKGYGEAHCSAIRGDWGNKDWQDIQAVIRFMQKQPYVDSMRMGVMGGSYGGYMTNWVISHTDVFRAAITDRCVSNLLSMAGTSDFPHIRDQYWEGSPWDRPEKLWNCSPIKYFGKVKTPTLIIHSEGDLRCNIEQAEQVFAALKLRKVPARFVRYPAETSHGMSRSGPPDLRIHRLKEILQWWEKYLKKTSSPRLKRNSRKDRRR
ncbi:MAG: S9 family peptidase [Fimbriimonadales bacterium]|nr:S9 family peptidase [Fimbriimonadales bacterium]